MIKAKAGATFIFGLSDDNIKMLKDGLPIHVDLREFGLPAGKVYIFYGPTEEIMETRLFTMVAADLEKYQNG